MTESDSMSTLSVFLRMFGLLPNNNVKKHSVRATLHVMLLNIPLLFIMIPITLDCYMNRHTLNAVSLTSFIYTIALFGMMVAIYIYLGWKKFQLRDILCELKSMAEKRRRTNPCPYRKAETYSDFVVKNMFAFCCFGTIGVTILPFAKAFVHHLQGIYTFESWYTPYPAYLPYNVTRTPIGFAFTLSGQIIAAFTAIPVSTIIIGLFATLIGYLSACFEDVSEQFVESDRILAKNASIFSGNDFREIILEIMKLHNWAIKFRDRVSDFLDGYAFLVVIASDLVLCLLMFQFSASVQNVSIQMYQASGVGSLSLTALFVFCFFGEMLTIKSLYIADAAYLSLWYRYPLKYQQHIELIIAYSQIPSTFTAKGLMNCNMAAFAGLVKTAISYYMVLDKTSQK